ncbi:MAG: C39 family peptidase [bacterium]
MKLLHAHAYGLITLLCWLGVEGALSTQAAEPARGGTLLTGARVDLTREGRPVGFITIPSGTRILVVSETGDGYLVVRTREEAPFKVSKESLSLDPISAATATPPPSPVASATTSSSTAGRSGESPKSSTPAPVSTTSSISSISNITTKTPTAEEVNKALGIPLFGSGSLWEENDAIVANRLRWPQESKTTYEAGYRRYPYTFNTETRVLGVRSLALFLQGVNDKTARATILFANKGDVAFFSSAREARQQAANSKQPLNVTDNMLRGFQDAMRKDKATLESSLRALFGDALPARTGRFATTAEAGQRWDWKGHTFLLMTPPNEYVLLRILPTVSLDDDAAGRKSFAAAKANLSKRVERRENGDVLISDLPMVDQGRKGYCVPATFERVLRYYGLSEDMNILATAGKTGAGGGTSVEAIQGATYNLLRDAGANISQKTFSGSIQEIKPIIDAGKPILFTHYSTEDFNKRVNERMAHRVAVTNWEEWKNNFLPSLKKTIPLQPDPMYGHICLIIGYNEKTREIAISDSWGPAATERWMTEEEARQIKQSSGITVIE